MILVNGLEQGHVDARDRGLLLGDGLFETLRLRDGRPQLWRYHLARLQWGLERLGLPVQPEATLLAELARVAPHGECMARVTITRGAGPRGYAPPTNPQPTRIVSAGEPLATTQPAAAVPLRLGWATVRIGLNPALAGLKHTSRLEHVLVRQSWERDWDEAIVMDAIGRVCSVTQGNLWLREGATLVTPPVDEAGIAGTRRAWIMDHAARFGLQAVEAFPEPERVRCADGLYVSNARVGITPARLVESVTPDHAWQDDPVYRMSLSLNEAS